MIFARPLSLSLFLLHFTHTHSQTHTHSHTLTYTDVDPDVDEKSSSTMLESFTAHLPYACVFTVVPNAFSALECAETSNYTLIIARNSMDDIHGLEFMRILETVHASVPVALLLNARETIDAREVTAQHSLFLDVLRNPYSIADLCRVVELALARGGSSATAAPAPPAVVVAAPLQQHVNAAVAVQSLPPPSVPVQSAPLSLHTAHTTHNMPHNIPTQHNPTQHNTHTQHALPHAHAHAHSHHTHTDHTQHTTHAHNTLFRPPPLSLPVSSSPQTHTTLIYNPQNTHNTQRPETLLRWKECIQQYSDEIRTNFGNLLQQQQQQITQQHTQHTQHTQQYTQHTQQHTQHIPCGTPRHNADLLAYHSLLGSEVRRVSFDATPCFGSNGAPLVSRKRSGSDLM